MINWWKRALVFRYKGKEICIQANVHTATDSDSDENEPATDTSAAIPYDNHPSDDVNSAASLVEDDLRSIEPTPDDVEAAKAQALTPKGPALLEDVLPSEPARQASTPPPEIRQLMSSYADVFPASITLGLPVQPTTGSN